MTTISNDQCNNRHLNTKTYAASSTNINPRFQSLDTIYIQALEKLFKEYPILNDRIEFHLPSNRAKQIFSEQSVWVWPKFDKRPVTYLIFMESFAPCLWNPARQEGITFKWLLPPNFCQKGPIVCLANLLSGESTLQIEDLIIYNGNDIWSSSPFSERWEYLRKVWNQVPDNQPLLSIKPRVVQPVSLDKWPEVYDSSLSWIIQHDDPGKQRWFWHDNVTVDIRKEYVPPTIGRKSQKITLCANCRPYTKLNLPDTYALYSQDNTYIGLAGISSLSLSKSVKEQILKVSATDTTLHPGFPVEVEWNPDFKRFQICCILSADSPISPSSFFLNS